MFAVIKTGGKQYKVSRNDVITVEKLHAEPGDTVAFETVLMLGGETTVVGAPTVKGATVAGAVVEQARGPKTIAFFKRRRQNSKRKKGHRQDLTIVRITDIFTNGEKVDITVKAAPAPVADKPPAAEKAPKAAKTAKGAVNGDNISLIDGLSLAMEKKMRAAHNTTLTDIAAWTEADIAKFDAEFSLKGRITREEWPAQAQELLDGKPPRAKVDQKELASGKDH
ncbi:MAG: 50S ribosomal protein L21 [Beijerinckiaceae bacterium]